MVMHLILTIIIKHDTLKHHILELPICTGPTPSSSHPFRKGWEPRGGSRKWWQPEGGPLHVNRWAQPAVS